MPEGARGTLEPPGTSWNLRKPPEPPGTSSISGKQHCAGSGATLDLITHNVDLITLKADLIIETGSDYTFIQQNI